MRNKMKMNSLSIPLFWKLFITYLILILIPVVVASNFIYFYIVKVIENEIEKSNQKVIGNFSEQTDDYFLSLQADILNFFQTSSLDNFLQLINEPHYSQPRMEQAHLLMRQLGKIYENDLIKDTYMYFPKYDLIVDTKIYTNTDYYFNVLYPTDSWGKKHIITQFHGRKVLEIMKTSTLAKDEKTPNNHLHSGLSMIASYPFNTNYPEVYLVIDLNQEKIEKHFQVIDNGITSSAIINNAGNYILNHDAFQNISEETLSNILHYGNDEPTFLIEDKKGFSFIRSEFNNNWFYVSLVDLEQLMKPSRLIEYLTMLFFAFFVLVGIWVSYYLSKRLFNPIEEIKNRLEKSNKNNHRFEIKGNEIKAIYHYSSVLINENNELFNRYNEIIPVVQEHFIKKILLGQFSDNPTIKKIASDIGLSYIPNLNRTVICIKINRKKIIPDKSNSFLLINLKEKIHETFQNDIWMCQSRSNLIVCILHHNRENMIPQMTERLKEITAPYTPDFKITISIGKSVNDIKNVHISYEHALTLMKHEGLHYDVEIYAQDFFSEERSSWNHFLTMNEVRRISNHIKAKEYDRAFELTSETLKDGSQKNVSTFQAKSLSFDILNTWIRALETDRNTFSVSDYSNLYEAINRATTWDDISQTFLDFQEQLSNIQELDIRNSQFSKIIDYIHNHFDQELSIKQFSSQLGMSTGNFSRLFKEVTGENYLIYITKLRISLSKKLLQQTELRIDDIAEKVGYYGRNSFIRVFKKYEGVTPGKYRELSKS